MAALHQQLLQWGRGECSITAAVGIDYPRQLVTVNHTWPAATLAPPPQLGISRQRIADISRHDINIVHVQRPLLEGTQEALQEACQTLILHASQQHRHQPTYRVQTALPVQQPEEAFAVAEHLVSQLLPSLQGTPEGTWLLHDICSLAAQFQEAVPFNPDTGEYQISVCDVLWVSDEYLHGLGQAILGKLQGFATSHRRLPVMPHTPCRAPLGIECEAGGTGGVDSLP
jgi:hypothetical protein